jgi:arsenate reductase (thioredoxin)
MLRSCTGPLALVGLCAGALVAVSADPPKPVEANRVATALAFAHEYGKPDALAPANDRDLKVRLMSALGKSSELSAEAAGAFMDRDAFRTFAGDGPLTVTKMESLLRSRVPKSRADMHAKLRAHADLLTTQFDTISDAHRKGNEELVKWIVKHYEPGKELSAIVMCTGNTRRSMLGSTMGNVAAAYYGLPGVRFYSGGTAPDAFNPRTVASLKEIGVEIEPTGKEAARGKADTPNPIYRVCWGKGLEALEFSKKYTDAHNPQKGFASILVCSEADDACPVVPGASARVPVPYLDPKAFDGAPFESAKYAERRDDIGRFMLSALMQARRRLELDGKLK